MSFFFSIVFVINILTIIHLHRKVKVLEVDCKVIGKRAYDRGLADGRERAGLPIEEKERAAYVQGLKQARQVSRQELCEALTRLFWKVPMPQHLSDQAAPQDLPHVWAEYWIAELADAPGSSAITGIAWDRQTETFVPTLRKV